jgi:hypothetical protein
MGWWGTRGPWWGLGAWGVWGVSIKQPLTTNHQPPITNYSTIVELKVIVFSHNTTL